MRLTLNDHPFAILLLVGSGLSARVLYAQPQHSEQASVSPETVPSLPMASNRAADSYSVYLRVLSGEPGLESQMHDLWVISDTTLTVVPPGNPCSIKLPLTKRPGGYDRMNPHVAITPPKGRKKDFNELLADFDKHCHERLLLESDVSSFSKPFALVDDLGPRPYRGTDAEAKPGPIVSDWYRRTHGVLSFSQVYFNAHHTVAMVYSSQMCYRPCGLAGWMVFERRNRKWYSSSWFARNAIMN